MSNFCMTLYYNTIRQNAKNTKYPQRIVIFNAEDLKRAVAYDHVCAEYKDGYRKNDNFIKSDCNMFDVDNTDSDNPGDWITPEDVRNAFPDVPFYVSYSRNHLKQKGNRLPDQNFISIFQTSHSPTEWNIKSIRNPFADILLLLTRTPKMRQDSSLVSQIQM